ncbi:MAG TPA: sulfatase-like hydrolase/transferase [Solirubrobacteraceae bacterium]|jgi:arylsulfatase A-like enzyme|nr:sulfatase-like hydrolase/transferase [Solirubrobacteraceae bacterium]
MTDDEPARTQGEGRIDRRRFLARTLKTGGLITAASLGAETLSDAAATTTAGRRHAIARRSRSSQPNILVIVVDQMRAPRWFGPGAGSPGLPPNIARLAREGVSFQRHYTASNDCSPARATMLTGLHTHQTGCMITGASTLDPGFPTYGRMLREQGYSTSWYGKWHLTRGDHFWNELSGPPALARYDFDGGTFPSPNGAPGQGWAVDPVIASQFETWLRQSGGDGPWCTTVSFVNPHDIAWWWRWSRESATEASAPSAIGKLPPNFETPEDLRARRKPSVQLSLQETSDISFGKVPYHGSGVTPTWLPFLDLYVKLQLEVDRQVGTVLRALRARPEIAANTIVLFTSDHGEYGASHGLRGKGAGMYEEGIRVPLIVSDPTGTLGAMPNTLRHQITSSVDLAPLLLTIGAGSDEWRSDPRYAHLATRADIARMLSDPAAKGRNHALHATDEVLTEFALHPYAASAPLHVKGLITHDAKYATYTNWRHGTIEPLRNGRQAELYDYRTRGGFQEIDNVAGHSPREAALASALEQATIEELRAPLPFTLVAAQQRGFAQYHELAAVERTISAVHRLNAVERIVHGIEQTVG